ncbi:MAG: hypothetical protein HY508_11880 [Acidobacteria bacterium]|nr:hypothetical protein [Acidobacteriota bacterium]
MQIYRRRTAAWYLGLATVFATFTVAWRGGGGGQSQNVPSAYTPFTLSWEESVPLDLSFLYSKEKPAGKHGFLTVKGDRLVFQDGTEGRFWGTCFNSGACFPPHAYSEMVARRLAKFGVNIVRFHQMDAEWATPNLFSSNRAKPQHDTRRLDPESLERLDYLIHCLKREGVYVYLDLNTYRQFLPGDGVDAVAELPSAGRPYFYFDRRMIELQKEFNGNLWTHVNPYTHLAYKDDPAIALSELNNECDLFSFPPTLEPYRTRLEALYRAWATKHGVPLGQEPISFARPDPPMALFFLEVMKDYTREMIAHLRRLGVRIPVNGTNMTVNLGVTAAQVAADFSDSHAYWNFPLWESERGTTIRPMVGARENVFPGLSLMRLVDRPFFVSEWDHAWPDPWRAESPLAYAAVAALQGWSGLAIHTYRYSTWKPEERIGGGGSTINGVTYRNHFDSFNDPAKFGLFYQAALLFRRGDVRPALRRIAVRIPAGDDWLLKSLGDIPALSVLPEKHRVGITFSAVPANAAEEIAPGDSQVPAEAGEVRSDTGELYRSWARRLGTIDTPRTKVAYGFVGEAGSVTLDGLVIQAKTDFATIALSSLTDAPISESPSLLLTAVGRSDNTEARYEEVRHDEARTRQTSFGRPPTLIEPIEARVALQTTRPNLKVWVISDKGEAVTRLGARYEKGSLVFEIGRQPSPNPSTIYYLIRE